MKLYCLIDDENAHSNERMFEYLKAACEARNIELVVLSAAGFDYGQDMGQVLETPSSLYRLSSGHRVQTLEALLLKDGVATMYKSLDSLMKRSFSWGSAIRLQKAGLPIIPTIFNIDRSQDDRLGQYVEQLGGFPIILKGAGGSHGSSVLKIDSLESLRSVLGYVSGVHDYFVLRKYIDNARHIRCVVIGDRVFDAIHYLPQPNDFRTNAVAVPQVEAFARNEQTEYIFGMAEQAVAALDLEFGGVDVLVGQDGSAAIAEVNFPCNFGRNQMNTGADVAGAIVDHLLAKVA
jgi:RimK family alpha-L-glutamate ligase